MDATAPYPELAAPAAWQRIDFVSDLHLAESTPATFAGFRAYLGEAPADALLILGDLFETWIGDDARHEGFEAEVAGVLREAARTRSMFFMAGNRDFLVGVDLLAACGIEALADPTVLVAFGERALLTHGDAWCLDDLPYQQFRRQVRTPAWQAQVLARPLAERRLLARSMRSESERRGAEHAGMWADVDRATALVRMAEHATPTLVHGHTHRPGSEVLATGYVRHVLSDWDLEAGLGTRRAEVLRRDSAGWHRLALCDALPAPFRAAALAPACPSAG